MARVVIAKRTPILRSNLQSHRVLALPPRLIEYVCGGFSGLHVVVFLSSQAEGLSQARGIGPKLLLTASARLQAVYAVCGAMGVNAPSQGIFFDSNTSHVPKSQLE